jgi:hypothetical protein
MNGRLLHILGPVSTFAELNQQHGITTQNAQSLIPADICHLSHSFLKMGEAPGAFGVVPR